MNARDKANPTRSADSRNFGPDESMTQHYGKRNGYAPAQQPTANRTDSKRQHKNW